MTNGIKLYEGRPQPKEKPKKTAAAKKAGAEIPDPYIAAAKLVKAVQYAQTLGRPLLLKGEPGCGKTRLAEAVAYELFGKKYKSYYFEWHIKSNSKAQEGLYVINHLQRLQDANIRDEKERNLDVILKENQYKGQYIELGELGKAFQLTNSLTEEMPPPIVLIDEIDKADIDFPNDLLLELDKLTFTINEARDGNGKAVSISAKKEKKPLILITSNDEKPLPPAFLRRCLFHYIDFPGPDDLYEILKSRKFENLSNDALLASSRLFSSLRAVIEEEGTATKNITTSELLDWINLINYHHRNTAKLFDIANEKSVLQFVKTYSSALAKDKATSDMLEDAKKSADVIRKAIGKYKDFVKAAEPKPAPAA